MIIFKINTPLSLEILEIYWTNQFGEKKNIKDLNDDHLDNIIKYLFRQGYYRTAQLMEYERYRRHACKQHEKWDSFIKEYASTRIESPQITIEKEIIN